MDAPARPLRRIPRWLLLAALGPLGWLCLSVAGFYPGAVEALYCAHVFPALRGLLGGLASVLPVSAAEVLVVLAALWGARRVARALRAVLRRERGLGVVLRRAVQQLLATAGLAYAIFLVTWGFNHARRPYAFHARLTVAGSGGVEELSGLLRELVREANELRERVELADLVLESRAGHVDPRLVRGYVNLQEEVPALRGGAPLVRFPWCAPLLTRLGISGIYVPFTGEAHVNDHQPAWARPFIAAHEVAHQRGFAREDEANFIAWQVCRASEDDAFRYSATYVAVGQVAGALRRENQVLAALILANLSPAVSADREESARFWRAHRGRLSDLSHASNDLYLKSQGQREGTRSYGRMVDLMLAEWRAGKIVVPAGDEASEADAGR